MPPPPDDFTATTADFTNANLLEKRGEIGELELWGRGRTRALALRARWTEGLING